MKWLYSVFCSEDPIPGWLNLSLWLFLIMSSVSLLIMATILAIRAFVFMTYFLHH